MNPLSALLCILLFFCLLFTTKTSIATLVTCSSDRPKPQKCKTKNKTVIYYGPSPTLVPDDLHSSRRVLQDGDIQRTLDRCFSVIQESSKVWSGATASALAQKKPLSENNSLQLAVTGYLSRFLKPSVYEKIKKRQTRLDHNLFDVIWPALRKTSKERHLEEDINCGIIAPDFDVYVVYQEFLVPLIKDMHCMSVTSDFKPHPRIAYFPMQNGERLNTAYFVFEDDSNLVVRCLVECSRNLDTFELPLNLTIGQIEQAERLMMAKIFTNEFIEAIDEEEPGSYYTLTEVLEDNSEVYDMLNSHGLLIPLLDQKDEVQQAESIAFNGSLWPYGRGVYVSASNNMALWLNCQEHLRIISTTTSKDAADIGSVYTRVGRCISFLEQQLHFKESYLLGYLQSRPSYLGTGLKMTTIVRLPNLMKEMDNLRHLCSVRGLALTTNRQSKLSVRLINMQSMGSVEHILFQDFCTAVTNILSLEKDMSLTNSKHIASMLVKIFRRKKNSLADRH
ncbi:arginine kinase [Musca vetustissima]|uniref:arginine kinase n=1 Tax=Musca vetustissima TaxID=27455 RepID=UPI002AB736EE|nr:arginine kinase [Musca vetustissima]